MNVNQLLSNRLLDRAADRLTTPMQTWLGDHPMLRWLVGHPIVFIVVALVSIALLWGLVAAIGRVIERLWLAILQFPLKLVQWLWRRSIQGFRAIAPKADEPQPGPVSQQEQLTDILSRLEMIQREQTQLLIEVKNLLIR